MKEKVEKIIQNLGKRKMEGKFFQTREEVKEALLERIGSNMTVGIGGSMTIKEIGLYDDLIKAGNQVYWHWMAGPEEASDVRRKAGGADLYLTSTNSITMDGELVNIDGTANRVASMVYGPKETIVVCGINKICPDLICAIDRAKNKVSIKNAKRLGIDTPCVKTGYCEDCASKDRICNVTTIISGKPGSLKKFSVYIVGEELGY